ncbi:dihydrolipoyl dehydrogenase family protein [Novosphingobium beihaiensis]|uniref:FAD-dependent oxidoreductase n=1 Tax=Novosphingobium beihaiensis TaxID=2930389 RepID=A0ABT0BLI2_9SPHN|nr:FAD-dependent oxidoreductase [Novosphingobium beihaiensis]MCJ2185813.1 FAD-dependent oxidoreductase [Novosphingobium beihaiensis]
MAERYDLCIIGAGSGGLSLAAGAAQMGAKVALIERGEMGGDCLNTGCVPSKALLAAGHAAQVFRSSAAFGIAPAEPQVDFAAVMAHVKGVIAAIAPNDSQERFEGFGVDVIRAPARFTGPSAVSAGDRTITAKRFVVATGSTAAIPPVPGLGEVDYLTNETLFELEQRPDHLMIIGAGPIGCEMAQAFRRLGSAVTLLDRGPILPNEDPDAAAVVREALEAEGIDIIENAGISGVHKDANGRITVMLAGQSQTLHVTGDKLLVAAGRRPNLDLGLDAAGIEHTPKGIKVDRRLRTSNRRVYAIGDCREGPQFTHAAGYESGVIVQNALLRLPAKVNYAALPRVVYTDPELAQVGLSRAEAERTLPGVAVHDWPFHENDRAQAERRTEGFARIVTSKGRIVGATFVGKNAGELLHPWTLAIGQKRKLRAMTGAIVAYPTLSEVGKRAASSAFTAALFGPSMQRAVRWLGRLP